MKTSIFLIFIYFFLTNEIIGQTKKFNYIDSEIKRIYPSSDNRFKNSRINSHLYLKRLSDFPCLIDTGNFLIDSIGLIRYHKKLNRYHSNKTSELFPGSSKYYAINPSILSSPYSTFFITKPDTSVKHFLIVQDPLKNTVTK
jgi:hypothetical protein